MLERFSLSFVVFKVRETNISYNFFILLRQNPDSDHDQSSDPKRRRTNGYFRDNCSFRCIFLEK